MDLVLLGAAAIVLVALTVWLVWRPAEGGQDDVRTREANQMLPQGDKFEDQYTSATADLSAGGVAVTAAHADAEPAQASDFQRASEPWSQPGLAHESTPSATVPTSTSASYPSVASTPMLPAPSMTTRLTQPKTISIGAAALLTLGSAIGGAWLYSRWQHARNRPVSRLVRRFK
jgi:hypothetical protein